VDGKKKKMMEKQRRSNEWIDSESLSPEAAFEFQQLAYQMEGTMVLGERLRKRLHTPP
jgi:hypothetical protein